MKEIVLSKDVSIPLMDYATQASAALGTKGSGKSQDMGYLSEQEMLGGIPITVLDPAGVWQYLKVPGRGKGFPVVVVGGEHSPDFPLSEKTVEEIMLAAMREGVSIVFDLYSSAPSKALKRSVVLKVVEAMFYNNKKFGPRHVYIEEAAEFIPQRVMGEHAQVYSAVEQLVRIGGNCSLGVTVINPRAENLNKEVLELCDYIFLHRQRGFNSLKNLSGWFEQSDLESAEIRKIIADTKMFKAGQCWFMSKDDEKPVMIERMPLKESFHPDRKTPEKTVTAVKRTVDVADFVTKLKAALPKPEEKKVVTVAPHAHVPAPQPIIKEVEKIVEVPILTEKDRELLTFCAAEIGAAKMSITAMENQMREVWTRIESELQKHRLRLAVKPVAVERPTARPIAPPKPKIEASSESDGEFRLGRRHRDILTALVQHGPMDDSKLGAMVGLASGCGNFRNLTSALTTAGCIVGTPGRREITEYGQTLLGPITPLPTGPDLVARWMNLLPTRAADMLKTLYEAGREMSDDEIGEVIGIKSGVGNFRNNMSELLRRDLVTGTPSARKIGEVFFQ